MMKRLLLWVNHELVATHEVDHDADPVAWAMEQTAPLIIKHIDPTVEIDICMVLTSLDYDYDLKQFVKKGRHDDTT